MLCLELASAVQTRHFSCNEVKGVVRDSAFVADDFA